MTTQELKEYINKVLGNSIRCLLPSYWWKKLFGLVVDKFDDITITSDTSMSSSSTNPVQNKVITAALDIIVQQIAAKQDAISDLDTIRSGASLGATALQEHQDISHLATKDEVIANEEVIAAALSDLDARIKDLISRLEALTTQSSVLSGALEIDEDGDLHSTTGIYSDTFISAREKDSNI